MALDSNTEIQEYLLSLVGNAPYGIFTVDLEGRIAIVNQTALDYFNINLKMYECVDRPLATVLGAAPEVLEHCCGEGTRTRQAFDLESIQVADRILSVKGRLVLNGMLVTAEDITSLKQAESDLLARTDLLAASVEELEQFTYVCSHDMQEPLKTIRGFVGLFEKKFSASLEDSASTYLEHISKAASEMSYRLNNLMDYQRIGKGAETTEVDSNKQLLRAIEFHAELIEAEAARIEYDQLPVLETFENELYFLFRELLNNALKARSTVPPVIQVAAGPVAEGWIFSVSDNGVGIEPAQQDRLFQIFQSHESRRGRGTGLAFCRKIVEMQGGRIWLESEPENGTSVHFILGEHT